MDLRLFFAISAGKIIAFFNRITGTGATAAPGLYALKIDPDLIKKLSLKIKHGNIIISGTNGKTTTSRLASDILSSKYKIINNRQGSNLLRGIASTLILKSGVFGNIDSDLGIWETDEATLPAAIENINPKTVVLLNLFRDQLDRYGEVNTTRTKWQKALSKLAPKSTLILNADDPGISYLAKNFKGKVTYFGVENEKLNLPQIESVSDIKNCLNCQTRLQYTTLLSAHLGHYLCPKCGLKRPDVQVSATKLEFKNDFTTHINLNINKSHQNFKYSIPGLYNVYNILAASALSHSLEINNETIKNRIVDFSTAFGRFQKVEIGGKKALIFLVKNPAGANEVIRTIATSKNLNILALLNDKIADGRDVSWIWDTNWEILTPKIKNLWVSGTRCWDLSTRFKYADVPMSKNNVYEDISYSLNISASTLSNKDTLIILPTYTAMLELQRLIAKKGEGTKWHKQ